MSNYYLFASLFSWIFPTKEDSKNFRHFCKEIDLRKRINTTHANYKETLERLKNKYKKEKIKVVFLNDTVAKWQYQSLYDELKNNPDFDVQILITTIDYQMKSNMKNFVDYKKEAEKCYDFFKQQGMIADYAFDFENNKPIDLRNFSPDIIFYEQPWGMLDKHKIEETSKFALTCYSSYGSGITSGKNEYGSSFFKFVYKYFVDNEFLKMILIHHSVKSESVVVSGHPKLDNYTKPLNENNIVWSSQNKKRIIYAPHFSFYKEAGLHAGTFNQNYKFFLEYAKKHQEFEFIFKPHPRLKEEIVVRKLMSEEECNAYYAEWANLPNTHLAQSGNYIDIFRTSDLLITDCNSFLFEYLPSENPVIRLINDEFIGHNLFGQKIVEGYYSANNNSEVENLIEQLLIQNNDPLKEKRINLLNSGIHPKEGYAKFVVNHLTKNINGGN